MKSNKGITLTSLIIYVIGMIIVMASISTLTTFFYKNIDITAINDNTTTQYTKFLSSFTEEINNKNNSIIDCKTNYIIFSSGNQYTYKEENKAIYKNKVKICSNVEKCKFSYKYQDSQYTVNIEFKAGNIDKTGNNSMIYTIKNGK